MCFAFKFRRYCRVYSFVLIFTNLLKEYIDLVFISRWYFLENHIAQAWFLALFSSSSDRIHFLKNAFTLQKFPWNFISNKLCYTFCPLFCPNSTTNILQAANVRICPEYVDICRYTINSPRCVRLQYWILCNHSSCCTINIIFEWPIYYKAIHVIENTQPWTWNSETSFGKRTKNSHEINVFFETRICGPNTWQKLTKLLHYYYGLYFKRHNILWKGEGLKKKGKKGMDSSNAHLTPSAMQSDW